MKPIHYSPLGHAVAEAAAKAPDLLAYLFSGETGRYTRPRKPCPCGFSKKHCRIMCKLPPEHHMWVPSKCHVVA